MLYDVSLETVYFDIPSNSAKHFLAVLSRE